MSTKLLCFSGQAELGILKGRIMDSSKDLNEVASALKNVATLMDTISIQLQNTNGERDQKFDLVRCALEDFREDLEEQISITINVDVHLLRKQIRYLAELESERNYFQGSLCFGPHSPPYGLDGVRNHLKNVLDIAENKPLPTRGNAT